MRSLGFFGVLCLAAAPVMAGPLPIANDSYYIIGTNFPSNYGPSWVVYDGTWDLAGGASGMYLTELHVDFPGIPGGIVTNEGLPSQGTIPEYALAGTGLEVGYKTADGEGINDVPGNPWGFTVDELDFNEIPIIAHDTVFVYFTIDDVVVDLSAMAPLFGFEVGPHPWAAPNIVPSVIYIRNPEYDLFHDMKLGLGYSENGTLGALLGTELTDMHVGMLLIAGPATLTLTVGRGENGEIVVEPNSPTYPIGTFVTLEAFPYEGKSFMEWRLYDPNYPGDNNHAIIDTNNLITIVMDGDREVRGIFHCGSDLPLMLAVMLGSLGLYGIARRCA